MVKYFQIGQIFRLRDRVVCFLQFVFFVERRVAKRENGVDVDLICELSTTSYHEISIDIVGRDSKSSPNRCPICEIGRDLYDLDC